MLEVRGHSGKGICRMDFPGQYFTLNRASWAVHFCSRASKGAVEEWTRGLLSVKTWNSLPRR